MKQGYVYILANKKYGTLYIGMTSDLPKRIYQHRGGLIDGFSKKYATKQLMYYETHDDITTAIQREKKMKKWRRSWKIELIETSNPQWRDLYDDLHGFPLSRE